VSESDSELIARAVVDDDRAAFGELVQRHQSAVRRFLRHLARGDDAWADDLAQETFILAHRQLARFRGEARFLTWLLGIAHNQFRNARRSHAAAVESLADTLDEHAPDPAHAVALRQDLTSALRQLSADEQTALHLCYQQGLSHDEAASALVWPIGTVKTHLARGKEKLRTLLSAWNPSL
jgi:RNA polymerase sigma factor (sigma-70 family)